MAAVLPFDTPPEKRATYGAALWRQLFVTPSPVRDVSLVGRTAIITGSNSGAGLECARQLLDLGLSRLILAVRDECKGQEARIKLLSDRQIERGSVEVWKLDLLLYDSIVAFADRAKTLERLDIAVLNAGIFRQKFELVASTGHEETIQVNFLSNALLSILLLLPILKPNGPTDNPGRLVVVSSEVASWTRFKERSADPLLPAFDRPESFSSFERYGTSKLLSQLLTAELAKRIPSSVAIMTMPTPGLLYGTKFGHLPQSNFRDYIGDVLKRIFGKAATVGTRSITAAAVKFGPEAHGHYVEDSKLQA
jgi:NAD(P)-dependent dehydrogenase (short-subunit alcohol dehydrogenase family)